MLRAVGACISNMSGRDGRSGPRGLKATLQGIQVTPEWCDGEVLELAEPAHHPGVGEPLQRPHVSADEVSRRRADRR